MQVLSKISQDLKAFLGNIVLAIILTWPKNLKVLAQLENDVFWYGCFIFPNLPTEMIMRIAGTPKASG